MRVSFFHLSLVTVVIGLVSACGHAPELADREGTGREDSEAPKAAPAAAASKSPPAEAAEADNRPIIVAFGDSLTAGFGLDERQSYPAVLERRLAARGYNYRIVNAGISGDTTSGGLIRVDGALAYKPKIVILELGANDGLRGLPVETTRANLEQMIETLQRSGAKVVLAGMTLPPNYGADYVRSFEQVFVDLSKKYHTARIPFLLDGVAAHPNLMQGDGLHPNAAGQRIVAGNVMRVLDPLLENTDERGLKSRP